MAERANPLTKRASGEDQPANTLRVFLDSLARLGYDRTALLAAAGLNNANLEDPDARIPCHALEATLKAACQQRPLRNLAMRLAAETPLGAFPLIDYLVLTSDSVGQGLKQLARYYRLAEAPYSLEFREDEESVSVLYSGPANAFALEYGVALSLLHLRKETEQKFSVAYVSFSHRPDDVEEMQRFLGCPVHSEALWNGFALPLEAWRLPLRRRDPILRSMLEQQADKIAAPLAVADPIVIDVRRVLARRLAKGEIQIEGVARALLTSTRSLQRRLATAGVSYQQVVDGARQEAADRYLSNSTLSIGEIAYLLGYSEPAAFHRAFRRWKGITPQGFRAGQNTTR